MADVHVLEFGDAYARMAVHIAIPNANNDVAVNYRTALIRSGIGGTTVLVDGDGTGGTISSAEKTSITTGAIYEFIVTDFVPESVTTNAERIAYIAATVTAVRAQVLANLQRRLRYFGYIQTVP